MEKQKLPFPKKGETKSKWLGFLLKCLKVIAGTTAFVNDIRELLS